MHNTNMSWNAKILSVNIIAMSIQGASLSPEIYGLQLGVRTLIHIPTQLKKNMVEAPTAVCSITSCFIDRDS